MVKRVHNTHFHPRILRRKQIPSRPLAPGQAVHTDWRTCFGFRSAHGAYFVLAECRRRRSNVGHLHLFHLLSFANAPIA
jgi:hypothetical protein